MIGVCNVSRRFACRLSSSHARWLITIEYRDYPSTVLRTVPLPIQGWGGHWYSNFMLTDAHRSLLRNRVRAKPFYKSRKFERAGFVKADDEGMGGVRLRHYPHAVDREKRVRNGKGGAFVAVDKGVVLRKAFPKRCRFFDEIGIIASLWPEKCGLKLAPIANSVRPAVAAYLVSMDGKDFDKGQIIRHSASFWYNGANLSWLA